MSEEINIPFNITGEWIENLKAANEALQQAAANVEELSAAEKKNLEVVSKNVNINKQAAEGYKAREKQVEVANRVAAAYEKVNKSLSGDKIAAAFDKINKSSSGTLQTFEEIEAEAKILQQAILNTSGDLQEQARLIQDFANKLSPEQQVAFFAGAGEAVNGLNDDLEGLDQTAQKPKRRLRELKEQLSQMDETDPGFLRLATEAAELEDKIGDVRARVSNLAADGKNLNGIISAVEGITGAFAVGQGAIALFGDESEELQKSLLKVQAVMAILGGLQAIQNTLLEESAAKSLLYANAQKLVAFTTGSASAATNVLRTALVATGIGALVVAVGLLAANWEEVTDAIRGTTAQQRLYSDIQKEAIKSYASEKVELDQLVRRYKENAENLEGRKSVIEELQKLNPKYFGALTAEKTTYDQLKTSVDGYVSSLRNKAVQEAGLTKLTEIEVQKLEKEQKKLDFIQRMSTKDADGFGGPERMKIFIDSQIKKYDEELKQFDIEAEKIQSLINKNQVPLDIFTDTNKEGSAAEDAAKKAQDLAKQAIEDRKREAEESRKLAEEQLAGLDNFYSELLDLQNSYDEKRRTSLVGEDLILEQSALNDELISLQEQQLKAELDGLNISEEQKKAAIENIDNAIAGLRAENIRETNAQLAELRKEETAKQREELQKSYDDRETLERANTEKLLNSRRNNFATEEEFENYKAEQLLLFDIQAAKERVDFLKRNGEEENKILIAQLEATIGNMEQQLATTEPADQNFLQKLFGLDNESFADSRQILSGVVSDTIALINQVTQARIEASQRVIDQLDRQISAQESAVNEEKELQEKGLANSVQSSQAALEELKKQRESAIAEQEKLRKRQATIEALQQAGALVTSATQMFASQAPKGLVGVALAIGAISTIFAYIQKVKADAAKTTIKARRGLVGDNLKLITGRSHERGGERLLDHVEVEDKELVGVLSREATAKYGDDFKKMVLDMNKGRFSPNSGALMLARDPEMKEAIQRERQISAARNSAFIEMVGLKSEIKSLKSELSSIKGEIQNWPKTYTDETGATVTKMGSKTIRRKKTS